MTNFYIIRFGLSDSGNQMILMQNVKSNGGDVIQLSDGLCVKWTGSDDDLQKLIDDKASGLKATKVDRDVVAQDPQSPADLKSFMGL